MLLEDTVVKRIRKRHVVLMLTLLILMSLAGCGKAKDEATDPTIQETISAVVETEPVNDTLNIIPTDMEIAVGESKTIPVNYLGEKRLFWNSSDMKIATVDSQGCVTAVSEGDVEIWVTDKELKDTVQIHIAPVPSTSETIVTLNIDAATLTLDAGSSKRVAYTYTGSNPLNWASYNTQVATVSQNGVVQAVGAGTAVISVSDGNLTSGVSIIVDDAAVKSTTSAPTNPTESVPTSPKPTEPMPTTPKPTELAPTTPKPTASAGTLKITTGNFTLNIGGKKAITYSYTGNGSLTWRSSDKSVATVSGGSVTAVGAGTAVISASDGKLNAQVQVTVNAPKPVEPTTPTAPAATLKITSGNFTLDIDGSKTVSYSYTGNNALNWSSSTQGVATVSGGTVKAVGAGTAVITVSDGKLNAQVQVTVNAPKPQPTEPKPTTPTAPEAKLEISRSQITLTVGESATLGYTYTGTGTIRFGADFGKVDVDQSGRITALRAGTDYVFVTDGKLEKVCVVDIKEPVSTPKVTNIEFSNSTGPLSGTYNVGNSLSWTATNKPNGSDYNVSVSSSNSNVATVSKSFDGRYNVITVNFVGEGSVTITVSSTDGGASNSASFNVKTYVPETPANELTPEQFARAVVNAMVSCGMEEASGLGGWSLVNVPEGDLNNSSAYSLGANYASHLYGNGIRHCNCVYIGRSEGKYQFYIQF